MTYNYKYFEALKKKKKSKDAASQSACWFAVCVFGVAFARFPSVYVVCLQALQFPPMVQKYEHQVNRGL